MPLWILWGFLVSCSVLRISYWLVWHPSKLLSVVGQHPKVLVSVMILLGWCGTSGLDILWEKWLQTSEDLPIGALWIRATSGFVDICESWFDLTPASILLHCLTLAASRVLLTPTTLWERHGTWQSLSSPLDVCSQPRIITCHQLQCYS